MPVRPEPSGLPRKIVDAVLFDTFGTVVDWKSGVADAVEAIAFRYGFEVDPIDFALRWRAHYQPAMEPIRDGTREFATLDVLHRENLIATARETGLPIDQIDAADLEWLNRSWHRLDGWPDSVPGLTELKRHFIIGPLSNGHVALLTNMAKHADLPWDVIIGSDVTRAYKPDPNAYLGTARLLDLPPERVMLCAAHNSDLAAAKSLGLRTAFVARPQEYGPSQRTDLHPTGVWDVIARDIQDLASQLINHTTAG
ncbi:haloacid dehalogenase type II [Saccharopolyspora sp. K220]|uniref:haloacid dehalogenase type II n=1 Tax=Saccharopolyspora soli TaxID=2926618 RepID=UPI001F57999C|nr:haloacid dehalogenase type II [Saccharopolyspora soli]MCI2423137.1 haloacid dehalogenase type II [Saccharopolyspora soli]